MRNSDLNELRLWCLMDGKPGHQNQTLGLTDSIQRLSSIPVSITEINVPTSYPSRLLGPSWPSKSDQAKSGPTKADLHGPHLILGAGHSTHLAMLSAKYRFGGRAIVLMKPSLPMNLFDLCVVPDSHTIRPTHSRVLMTRGVLNRIIPSKRRRTGKALVLLGGPSGHFEWSNNHVLSQLQEVISANPRLQWTVANSRRTPDSLLESCEQSIPGVELVRHDRVDRFWLPQQIDSSEYIWVTEDSVSMTYEAVTSGAVVGIVQLPRHRSTRVTINMDRLVESGSVTPWEEWKTTGCMRETNTPLFEADRVARQILARFFPETMLKIELGADTTNVSHVTLSPTDS